MTYIPTALRDSLMTDTPTALQNSLPERLEKLAADMEAIAASLEPIHAGHASELRGAAEMAMEWTEHIRAVQIPHSGQSLARHRLKP